MKNTLAVKNRRTYQSIVERRERGYHMEAEDRGMVRTKKDWRVHKAAGRKQVRMEPKLVNIDMASERD